MPATPTPKRIAHHLCNLVEQRLWPLAERFGGPRLRGASLRLRVGSGRATYCRAAPGEAYLITFGQAMVASKCRGDEAGAWVTAREIRRRGYYGGVVTLPSLLALTALHEFAHLLQMANGWRTRGSVHNARFYAQLDRLHAEAGEAARAILLRNCRADGIDLVALQQWGPGALPEPGPARDGRFAAGMQVEFDDRHGRAVRGVVRRVNRRSVTVLPAERSGIAWYRVSPDRLRRL